VPFFVRTSDTQTCPSRSTYYSTQARPDLTTVYAQGASGCGPVAPPANTRFYQLGAQVAPDELDQFKETREGTGRLQRRVLTDAEGAVDRLSNPFDTTTGDRCDFVPMADGTIRCVPPGLAARGDLFSDGGCQNPAGVPARSLVCGPIAAPQTSTLGGPWCAPVASVHALATTPGPVWQRDPDGTCEPTAVPGYSAFGAAREPGAFVAADEIRE
jgi:hypothetical protein